MGLGLAGVVAAWALSTGASAQSSSVLQELDRQQDQLLIQLREQQRRGEDRRDDRRALERQDDLRRDAMREDDRRRQAREDDRRARERR